MKKKFKQNGFTLLEVMIAMIILSVGLLGMAALTASIVRTNSFSEDYTTSAALAQHKLEELANTSFANVLTGNDTVDSTGVAGTKYRRAWTVGAGTRTKTIQVSVTWTGDTGVDKSISMNTIKSSQ